MNHSLSFTLTSLATALLCLGAGAPHAQAAAPGTVDLITTPPELTAKVAPNVVLTLDDSGSMGRNYVPDSRPFDNGSWSATDQQTTDSNASYPYDKNPWLCAGVIDPRVTDPSDPRSWPMNGVYYNPNSTYRPLKMADGSEYGNSTFSSAWDNGIKKTGSRDLGSGSHFCGKSAGYYRYMDTAPNLTLTNTGKISNTGDLYKVANWEWVSLPPGERQNCANWYSYYHTRYLAAVTSMSHAFAQFDQNVRVAAQNLNKRKLGSTVAFEPFESTARTDFYTWLYNTPVGSSTPNVAAAKRVGEIFTGGKGVKTNENPYWDVQTGRELACRKNFSIHMTDGFTNETTRPFMSWDTDGRQLPDDRDYDTSDAESRIVWNENGSATVSFADLAFHYWATNLRDDLPLQVRPYLADRTTGVTVPGAPPLVPGDNWLDNKEVYWNPANNPATWPHLVQYIIGFGVSGTLPQTEAVLEDLRTGAEKWPAYVNNNIAAVDDMWHAALNSRGQYFNASDPDALIAAMEKIIAAVVAQTSSSTPATIALPILTGDNDAAYHGGYDTVGWPGSLQRVVLDAAGSEDQVLWDASCILTGGDCKAPAASGLPATNPNSRIIVTSTDGRAPGIPFKHSKLTTAQTNALGTNGVEKVDYLRGKRDQEAASAIPRFRARQSVLGAIVNGELAYVSSPKSGYHDIFPPGSPEDTAAAISESNSYAGYQNAQRQRHPMVYAGANDGMLHAFDGSSGVEKWAFVPDTVIRNGRMNAMTDKDAELVPGVDSTPRERDVFIKRPGELTAQWRTVLVGSLRLGGRGVYALDVTNPAPASEVAAQENVLWEFSNGAQSSATNDPPCAVDSTTCASLGYTYDSVNIMRLRYQNKWAAVVSSGYFPDSKSVAANEDDINEPAASRTSLLVIDLETGKLIREIQTSAAPQTVPAGFKTFGLSTPMVYDVGSDEVDDLVYAGDLAGNLWRFDLSDENDPANWKVDLMFTTYGNGGASAAGDQPIVFNPSALRDPVTRRPILVVGTGKYLGGSDRTIVIPEQAWYGVRDYGTGSSFYPIRVNQLITQTLAQTNEVRSITGYTNATSQPSGAPLMQVKSVSAGGNPVVDSVAAHGWRIRLNLATEPGERAERRALPMVTGNIAFLYGLIPKSDDPCDPGARYSLMAVDAGTGAALSTSGTGRGVTGATLNLPNPPATPIAKRGGGGIIVGLPAGVPTDVQDALNEVLGTAIPPWHRGAWRELLGQ